MTRQKRLTPADRKRDILDAAVRLAHRGGYHILTRDRVAAEAGVATGLVSTYYTMPALKSAVMRYAVKMRLLSIVAQGLTSNDPVALQAPRDVRLAAQHVSGQ